MDYALCKCSDGVLCWGGMNGPCGGPPVSKEELAETEKKWKKWRESPEGVTSRAIYYVRLRASVNAWVRQEAEKKRVDELFKKYGCFAFFFL